MSAHIDGGPAFPVPAGAAGLNGDWHYADPGMTLRDWFAGMALQGMTANHDCQVNPAAEKAYRYADAMLAARKVGGV